MEGESFNPEELRVLDWQYTIIHQDTSCFKEGNLVFLKSNPEIPMTVVEIGGLLVYVTWLNKLGDANYQAFPPQTLLQYKLACFVTGRRKFHLCLN